MKKLIMIFCLIPSIVLAGDAFNQATDVYRIIAKAYSENALSAKAKYEGMEINIQGEVFTIDKNLLGYPTVTLKAGTLCFVACEFPKDSPYISLLVKLSKGDNFKCKGTIRGKVIRSVYLEDCALRQ